MTRLISAASLKRRAYWVEEIRKLSGDFGDDSERLEKELRDEIAREGLQCLIDHLRLCGDIPESYEHDSSEEKLYSKYTDALLSESYKAIGLKSIVIKERADAADVEAFAADFSFVSDAKAFRLSRTAKNQKDFKVQAMDGWKRGKPFAMVVCPIYQLPTKASQIYEQATSRNVCIFTFSHLAMLVAYSSIDGRKNGVKLLRRIFDTVNALNPSKDASAYWLAINQTMLGFAKPLNALWSDEKRAGVESIAAAREEALTFLAKEREKIMKMSHDEALVSLLLAHRIDNRAEVIQRIDEQQHPGNALMKRGTSKADYLDQIVMGNCHEVLRSMGDDFVNLVVTSPPYDNLRDYTGYEFDVKDVAEQLYRVVVPGGVVVWVIADATISGSETGTSFKQALTFMQAGFNLHDTMIFKKRNPIPQIYRKRYTNEFEYMFVFAKGTIRTHNPLTVDCLHAGLELGSTTYKNYSKRVQTRKKLANPVKSRKIKGNIWEYVVGKNKEDQEAKGHPAPFPCQLVADHVASWSNPGDVVLDPLCGSGTTCKVAKQMRRRYIGIEISGEYCELARKRVNDAEADSDLMLEFG